jgi:hypothetical protein
MNIPPHVHQLTMPQINDAIATPLLLCGCSSEIIISLTDQPH